MIRPTCLMINALAAKELRTRMRERDSIIAITLYLAVLGAVTIVFLIWHSVPSTGQSSRAGVQLFQALAITQLLLILLVTPASTAGTVSGERQRQTWELLLLTRLSAFDIVWGKLLAGLAFNLVLILASLPPLSAVFLFGGVAPSDVLHAYVVFFATVVLLGAISLFVSVLSRRPAVSALVSAVLSLSLGVGLSIVLAYSDASSQDTSLTDLNQLGSLSAQAPQLTPLMQVDPLVVLLSVLPDGDGSTMLGGLDLVPHAFGLPLDLPLWQGFGLVTLASTIVLVALCVLLTRPRFWRLWRAKAWAKNGPERHHSH